MDERSLPLCVCLSKTKNYRQNFKTLHMLLTFMNYHLILSFFRVFDKQNSTFINIKGLLYIEFLFPKEVHNYF